MITCEGDYARMLGLIQDMLLELFEQFDDVRLARQGDKLGQYKYK